MKNIYEPKKRRIKLDFKRNLKTYWSFLSKYKLLFALAALFSILNESLSLIEKFLFKVVIDRGTAYDSNSINLEVLSTIFLTESLFFEDPTPSAKTRAK